MELLVAGFDDIKFNVEIALDEQHGALPLPFNGMDSKWLLLFIYLNILFRISVCYYCIGIIWELFITSKKVPIYLIMFSQKVIVNWNDLNISWILD